MIRDVFYYGKKPNVHPREKFANSFEDAKRQNTTEHFWIINEFCDYTNFDWDFDFDFLPDEDVWTFEHINIFPSNHQKDSGTWLCYENCTDIKIYRNENPIKRKNIISDNWVFFDKIDTTKFDLSWHPDPTDPPYIYRWGCKFFPVEIKHVLQYNVSGATLIKYMGNVVELLPSDYWVEVQKINKDKFDLTWRPHPHDDPFIYVWGNKHVDGRLKSTLEYHSPNAVEKKYMPDLLEVLPEHDKWQIFDTIDKTKFDFTWRPDPTSPPYIYVWGNKHVSGKIKSTLEYHCENAVDKKYMSDDVELLPEFNKWKIFDTIDKTKFDFTWRPDPTSPPYIYVWGNKHVSGKITATLEYHCENAVDKKYMSDDVELLPEPDKWQIFDTIDKTKFDFTWRPDPTSPPYIYVWGNKHVSGKIKSTIEYNCVGAADKKFMSDDVELLPELDKWVEIQLVDKTKFDLTWRPDPTSPPYIYVWGNKHVSGVLKSTIEYHCKDAIEKKYMTDDVQILPEIEKYKILIPIYNDTFDFTWRPDPTSPPYIYVWGNIYNSAEKEPTIEYYCEGATERKYMNDQVPKPLPIVDNWKILIPVTNFDYSWRPDPHSPPYIYVFGNQWNDAVKEPTLEYHVEGATQKKYVDIVAYVSPDPVNWITNVQIENFDYSWRPDPYSPPYIYQFGTIENPDYGPKYITPNNNGEVVKKEYVYVKKIDVAYNKYFIETSLTDLIALYPTEVFWALRKNIDYKNFDFSWRPGIEQAHFVHVFGSSESEMTQSYFVNAKLYLQGHKQYNFVSHQDISEESLSKIFIKPEMFFVDRGNKESSDKLDQLKLKFKNIQKTRYLNSWVDTINRCATKSSTELFWVLSSEYDYSNFDFNYYPNQWQLKMVHVFGTQWSHWGNTYLVNKETFPNDTKHIKIIEHLSNLNFVKNRRAVANTVYDIVFINHGNFDTQELEKNGNLVIDYDESYLKTFKNLLLKLPNKREHYIWAISTICDYSNFDFTYICDPYAKDQLHVFPSDLQKFGDTFLIDVNKLRFLINDLKTLEDYNKINFNQHQRVSRFLPPVFVTSDTHTENLKDDYKFPYAVYITKDHENLSKEKDSEPISLWDNKDILITSTGGTRLVVPKIAKQKVKKELYSYPYIKTSNKLLQSNPLDIIFFSNGEIGSDEHYEHLCNIVKNKKNRCIRIDGIIGRVASQHAAANASNTPWYFLVNAKLFVNKDFNFDWQPDRLQIPKHYIFLATNPVNGLEYGHQAIVANNKNLTLNTIVKGLDFTMDSEHEVINLNSGIGRYNTSVWDTYRTAFRECIKLKHSGTEENKNRLDVWLNKAEGNFAEWSLKGAIDAIEYHNFVDGNLELLKLSYDWAWIKDYFNTKYPNSVK